MEPDRESERTDPRVLRTRKLIEEAFLAVLNEKGFEELSIQDVADGAGINRATFYSHYGDKYELMADWIRKDFTKKLEEKRLLDRALTADSVREIFTLICAYVAALHGHCKPPHRHLDWMLEQEITEYCADLFCRWAGETEKSLTHKPFRMKTTAAAGAMYALVLEWLGDERRTDVKPFISSVLTIVTSILE